MTREKAAYQNIEIEDVDQALFNWFDLIVNAHVEFPTQEVKKVPVIFASGERWATARDEKGIRDKNGLLILPLISIRRVSIDRNREKSALGTETKRLTISKQIDKKTSIIQNAISNREISARKRKDKVVYEVTTIPFPDWCVTNYEVVVQAQYITQMNKILEFIFAEFDLQNQFVMPVDISKFEQSPKDVPFENKASLKGYYFVGFVNTDLNDTGNFEEFTDTERIVKYAFNVEVPTYFQLDPQGKKPAIQVEYTAFDVRFPDECVKFVDNVEELDEIFSYKKLV